MIKRVFIIHGWGGRPDKGWLAWLNKKLSKKGFEVYLPVMPDAENPKIETWVSYLKKLVGKTDENTYFIGHSIGCQTIMRYLENIKTKVGGIIFVAGWFTLKGLESKEEEEIAQPWLKTAINLNKIKKKAKKIIALFSDDDPYIPLENIKIFKEKLNAKIIIEKNKGHYIENVTKEIPVVLKEIEKWQKKILAI